MSEWKKVKLGDCCEITSSKKQDRGQVTFRRNIQKYNLKCYKKMRRQDTDLTLIILSSSDTPNVGDHDGDMSETKLTERQQKILNLIKESPTITGKQMSEILSVSQRTIERDLSAMQKLGVLKREGKDNDGTWIVFRP